MRHFVDERGQLPSCGVRPLVRFMGSIVSALTALPRNRDYALGVRCRRRPGHRRCPGEIHGRLRSSSGEIWWACPECGDDGVITHWEGTPWDRLSRTSALWGSQMSADVALDGTARLLNGAVGHAWHSLPPEHRLRVLNNVWCVSCSRGGGMKLTGARLSGGDLVLIGECLQCGGEVRRVVELPR
jgi:hypothetical protein